MSWPTQQELAGKYGYAVGIFTDNNDPRLITREVWNALGRYVVDHEPVGDFLRACLENNFQEAALRADFQNVRALKALALTISNEMPSTAHGSAEAYQNWIKVEQP